MGEKAEFSSTCPCRERRAHSIGRPLAQYSSIMQGGVKPNAPPMSGLEGFFGLCGFSGLSCLRVAPIQPDQPDEPN
jgi:hypothetical protein